MDQIKAAIMEFVVLNGRISEQERESFFSYKDEHGFSNMLVGAALTELVREGTLVVVVGTNASISLSCRD